MVFKYNSQRSWCNVSEDKLSKAKGLRLLRVVLFLPDTTGLLFNTWHSSPSNNRPEKVVSTSLNFSVLFLQLCKVVQNITGS